MKRLFILLNFLKVLSRFSEFKELIKYFCLLHKYWPYYIVQELKRQAQAQSALSNGDVRVKSEH